MSNRPKLLYFVTEDWYFWSHRKSLALAAAKEGYDVFVLTHVSNYGEKIEQLGFNLIPINLDRHGKNIFRELELLFKITKIYRKLKPDIVHHIALKPILYGTVASVLSKVENIVNAFPGLGYVFHSIKTSDRIISFFLKKAFMLLFKYKSVKIIVQNIDNAQLLVGEGVCEEKDVSIIKGSGVDLSEYRPISDGNTLPIVLFASRLLWQKGVADFVAASSLVRKQYDSVRFVIVGEPDLNNPNSVPEATLRDWNDKGQVEWWGFQDNMPAIISQSKIVVLPTYYGEGIPKILIEAAASAKPIVTTDTPGCREIVRHGVNGFLVPIHDPETTADYIYRLLGNDGLCLQMGIEGRKLVGSEFSIDKVNSETLQVYNDLFSVTKSSYL